MLLGSWHQSQILWWFVLASLFGIAQLPVWAALIGLILVLVWQHQRGKSFSALCMLFSILSISFSVGVWRWHNVQPDFSLLNFESVVTATGIISQPPIIAKAQQRISVTVNGWPANVTLNTTEYPRYQYGDVITFSCKFSQFGFGASCYRPIINTTGVSKANSILKVVYDWRDTIRQQVYGVWRQPTAGIVLGLLLGLQDDLNVSIVDTFRSAGVIHILVVSGMHVAIVLQLLTQLLRRWLSPFWQVFVSTLALVLLCIITGLAASVIRASIMGLTPLLARLLHRPVTRYQVLVLIVGIMVWQNPFLLLYNLGFQLSFLATLGLLYLQKPCDKWLWWLPESFSLRETVATTVAATITTTPLLLYSFGTFSVVSVLSNIVVIPLSNIILFSSAGILCVAVVLPQLGQIIAPTTDSITQLMLWWVETLAEWPYAWLQGIPLPLSAVFIFYSIFGGYIIWQEQRAFFM